MSAEDWIPEPALEDPWYMDQDQDEDGTGEMPYGGYRQRRHVICKRCGKDFLHWSKHEQGGAFGWRLFNEFDELHECPAPRLTPAEQSARDYLHRSLHQALSTPVPSTTQEPIMDKNAVAFIRSDVRTLSCVFITSERVSLALHQQSVEQILQHAKGGKSYTYLTTDPSIQAGDFVVVIVSGIPKIVFVEAAWDELTIEPNAPYEYAYVVSRIDFSKFERLREQNEAISKTLRTSYKATIREGFRQTLLAGLPEGEQAAITLLLNNKES